MSQLRRKAAAVLLCMLRDLMGSTRSAVLARCRPLAGAAVAAARRMAGQGEEQAAALLGQAAGILS